MSTMDFLSVCDQLLEQSDCRGSKRTLVPSPRESSSDPPEPQNQVDPDGPVAISTKTLFEEGLFSGL